MEMDGEDFIGTSNNKYFNKDYAQIDARAIRIAQKFQENQSSFKSAESVARSLVKNLSSSENESRFRAIFKFLTEVMRYDFAVDRKCRDVMKLLRGGIGVCSTYCFVFKSLCECAGLVGKVRTISGHAKGAGYRIGEKVGVNHDWSMIHFRKKWRFVDVTWAAGSRYGNTWRKQFSNFWWCTPPRLFVFSHYPPDDNDQLLERIWSFDQFLRGVRTYSFLHRLKNFWPKTSTIKLKKSNVVQFKLKLNKFVSLSASTRPKLPRNHILINYNHEEESCLVMVCFPTSPSSTEKTFTVNISGCAYSGGQYDAILAYQVHLAYSQKKKKKKVTEVDAVTEFPEAHATFSTNRYELIGPFSGVLDKACDYTMQIRASKAEAKQIGELVLFVKNRQNVVLQRRKNQIKSESTCNGVLYECPVTFKRCQPKFDLSVKYRGQNEYWHLLSYRFNVNTKAGGVGSSSKSTGKKQKPKGRKKGAKEEEEEEDYKERMRTMSGYDLVKKVSHREYEIELSGTNLLRMKLQGVNSGVRFLVQVENTKLNCAFVNYYKKDVFEVLVKMPTRKKTGVQEFGLIVYAKDDSGGNSYQGAIQYKVLVKNFAVKELGFPLQYALFSDLKYSLIEPLAGILSKGKKYKFKVKVHKSEMKKLSKLVLFVRGSSNKLIELRKRREDNVFCGAVDWKACAGKPFNLAVSYGGSSFKFLAKWEFGGK